MKFLGSIANPVERMEQLALTWPERAQALEITDQVTYDMAVRLLGNVSALEAKIIEHHKPIKDATNKAHKEACAAEKRLLDPVLQAKLIFRRMIAAWNEAQERIRREEERKAIEAAAREEEALRLEMVKQAEELGASQETIEDIKATQIPIPRPQITPTFQAAAGVSSRVTWHAELQDIRALCRAVSDGKVSPLFVQPDMVALNGLARSMKQTMDIPGVKAVRDAGITFRRS